MVEVLLAGIGVLLFFMCLALPLRHRLLMVLVSSVPQIYLIQIAGADVSLAFLLPILLLPEFIKNANIFLAKLPILAVLVLICCSIISLLWSGAKSAGIRDIAYYIEFIVIANAVYVLARTRESELYKITNVMLFFVCLQAVTIVLFRLNETLELSIVLSPISKYTMGNNTLTALLEGVRNNFYDPVKAGGILFINANAAACYVGISSFMAWGIFKAYRTKISLLMAIFLWVTVFFTGSKAGVLFSVLIPLFIVYLKLQKQTKIYVSVFCAIFALMLISIGVILGMTERYDFLNQSAETAETRYQIWGYAFDSFINSPLMGQGFGGWEENYSIFSNYYLPPHNTLIFLWSKSGLLAALMGLLFIVSCLRVAFKGIRNQQANARELSYSFTMVIAWLFAHGFGENFGLIGEQHQMIILTIMLGVCLANNTPKMSAHRT